MEIIKDLGMKTVGLNVYRTRYGLFKCEICGKEVEKTTSSGLKMKNCGCDKTHLKKMKKDINNRFFT